MAPGLFATRLAALRRTHNLTQAALAHSLGLARQGYISNLEAGRKVPSLGLVVQIADFFGVPTDYLLRDTVTANSSRTLPQHAHQRTAPRLFGAKLRDLRVQRNILQADLAAQLGITRQGYISNLETGKKEPSLHLVVRVADVLNVTTDYLLRDTLPVIRNAVDTAKEA